MAAGVLDKPEDNLTETETETDTLSPLSERTSISLTFILSSFPFREQLDDKSMLTHKRSYIAERVHGY